MSYPSDVTHGGVPNISDSTCGQSFSLFSPSIIHAMGYTDELAQLLSVGPYVHAPPQPHYYPNKMEANITE
jgi:hypothetical protein